MRIAASNLSLNTNRLRSFVSSSSLLSFEVELENDHGRWTHCAITFEARVSNRKAQRSESISQELLSELEASVLNHSQASIKFTGDRAEIAKIATATAMADGVRFRQRQCHEEFHSKSPLEQNGRVRNRTGFSPDTFEISFIERRRFASHDLGGFCNSPTKWAAWFDGDSLYGRAGQEVIQHWMVKQQPERRGRMVRHWHCIAACLVDGDEAESRIQVLAVAPILCRRATLSPIDFTRKELKTLTDAK